MTEAPLAPTSSSSNNNIPTENHTCTQEVPSHADTTTTTNATTSLNTLCSQLHHKIEAFLSENVQTETLRRVQAQTKISLAVIHQALDRYTLPELSFSYNGGKDCLVLLILYLSALHTHLPPPIPIPTTPPLVKKLQSIYIVPPHPFPEVERFVASSSQRYHLSLARHARESMKAAFADYLASEEGRCVKVIFVGTRRTDPHGGLLGFFDATDHGWPGFLRCHPVIDWHYGEIWAFLRHLEIPYCELYDRGYTSLGGTTDTHPNPVLKEGRGEEGEAFRPAYELKEDREERLGRDWR
ncbi:3'-phosphoadenosine 5'-phosphosulfate sulfotransferase [Varicellaria rhodocarpa]|nr:3'-phosphoadenosine 5'-phosphosulfate sulfotransferase [Varicellaria rhodocarpa]